LKLSKNEIVGQWISRARANIHEIAKMDESALVDSLSVFIDRLAMALIPGAKLSNKSEVLGLSEQHGASRAKLGSYSLQQLLFEYRLLREIVIAVLQRTGSLTTDELLALDLAIMMASDAAAVAFSATAEERHQQTEVQFRSIVEDAKDIAIFIVSSEGIILTWNAGATRIKQYEASEVIGKHFRILYRHEDRQAGRPEHNLRLAIEQGRFEERWWRMKKDGSLWWAEVIMTALYSPQGKLIGVSKIVRDLTAQRRIDDELREAKLAAEAANRLKSTFVANMSHEIRTPLGAIMGYSDLLKEPLLSTEERAEYASVIERNGQVLLRLIEDILDISKIEAGKLEIEYREILVRPLLAEVVALHELKARDKGLFLELRMRNDELPDFLVTDSVRLRQIISNVIGNAIKFTDKGGIYVLVSGFLQADQRKGLEVVVTDTGLGIPTDKRSRIFGEFTQADASVTRRYGGSGLGLALSRKLARELGGDLELLDSAEGGGTTFRITVANRSVAVQQKQGPGNQVGLEAANEREKRAPHHPYPHLKGSKVLLVEDSIDNQRLLKLYLTKAGVTVDLARDGLEGVEKASSGDYNAVLMDVQMPNMDGNTAAAELRKKGFDRPIIALTAHAMLEDRMRSLRAGCDDYLSKPVKSSELLSLLEKWVITGPR
jgi:hypothetical protein